MTDDNTGLSPSRRNVLKTVPAAGAYLSLGEFATGPVAAAEGGNGVRLGGFDDGLDGWKTTGGNKLTRVSEDEMPAAVTDGTHALAVEIDGDLHPMIENKKRVKQADFEKHPYLLMDVVGYAEETDSDLVFTLRLHHTATPADGGGKSKSGGKNVLVEESDEQTIAQLNPGQIRWDMTDLDDDVLRTAKRLEIVWYIEDHPPDKGHRGRAKGDFDYRGLVAFDDIRLTDDVVDVEAQARLEKKRDLHRKHGMIVERTFEEQSEGLERGTLQFADGAETSYVFEVLDDGRFRYTIDDETYKLGGGDSDE